MNCYTSWNFSECIQFLNAHIIPSSIAHFCALAYKAHIQAKGSWMLALWALPMLAILSIFAAGSNNSAELPSIRESSSFDFLSERFPRQFNRTVIADRSPERCVRCHEGIACYGVRPFDTLRMRSVALTSSYETVIRALAMAVDWL